MTPTPSQLREAQALHNAADRHAKNGEPVTAMLLDQIAWQLEHGITWLELMDDVQVRESNHV